jgi:cytoskeletal protein RodZ
MTIEGLGKKFQEARLARGLTLDEAARMTKIRPSRLAEIEADDFSQFPSLAYAKGFLLIYGKFLDVDVTPYMEAFEGSEAVTVDGYSYLQDNPAPEPTRAPIARRPRPRAVRPTSDRASLKPLIIGIIVIVAGFTLMRLILNIQRIGAPQKREMVGQQYAEPSASAEASVMPSPTVAPPAPPPAQSASPRIAVASPSASTPAPASPRVAAASPSASTPAPAQSASPRVAAASPASSSPSVAPASPPPRASPSVSAVAAASPAASSSPRPSPPKASPAASAIAVAASPSPAVAKTSPAASSPPGKEPEVRKAEPVKAEDLAKAAATEAAGPNRVAIRPLKKTYVKVVVDNEAVRPAFERWISPSDGTVEFRGQKIAVRVLDRDAVQIKKNGKTLASGDPDVTIE